MICAVGGYHLSSSIATSILFSTMSVFFSLSVPNEKSTSIVLQNFLLQLCVAPNSNHCRPLLGYGSHETYAMLS